MKYNVTNIDLNYNIASYIYSLLQSKITNETDLLNTTLIVPTKRFSYTLKESFLQHSTGNTSFVPKILTIADLTKEPLVKDVNFYEKLAQIKPKHDLLEQQVALYRLVKAKYSKAPASSVLKMVESLEKLIDDAALNNVDFSQLESLDHFESSEHFRQNLEFLKIIYKILPSYLQVDDIKKTSRLYYQEKAVELQLELIKKHKPKENIIAVGIRSLSKSVCLFLKEIAGLENGNLIFYGFDSNTADNIKENNPQYIYKQMLAHMGFNNSNVVNKTPSSVASMANNHKNLAYSCFNKQKNLPEKITEHKITNLNCKTKEEESLKVALILKKAFLNGKSSCLISYDHTILTRVDTILKTWGIVPNNSLGVPLSKSKNASYFASVFNLFYSKFNVVNFSAFIKHPLSNFGFTRKETLEIARVIDRYILRQQKIRSFKDVTYYSKQEFFTNKLNSKTLANCEAIIEQIAVFFTQVKELNRKNNKENLSLLCEIAEKCSLNNNGTLEVFSNHAGKQVEIILNNFKEKIENFNNLNINDIVSFITREFSKVNLRQQYNFNKQIAIMSPLEAYMLNFNTVVLAGMNDDVWPKKPRLIPWLGKATIQNLNLSSRDQTIGNDAFYFTKGLCNENIFITKSTKNGDSSRFLVALENSALTNNLNFEDKNNTWQSYYKELVKEDLNIGKYKPVFPAITHNLKNNLSVTALEAWYNDPFEFFVTHVLNLKPINKLNEDNGSLVIGNAVHSSLEEVIKNTKTLTKETLLKLEDLEPIIYKYLQNYKNDVFFMLKHKQNIKNIALNGVKNINNLLTKENNYIKLYSELTGSLLFEENNVFVKTRLDFATSSENNQVINIIDFKTGSENSKRKRIQLSLIKHIMQNNGFNDFNNNILKENTEYKLNYWFLKTKAKTEKKEQETDVTELVTNFAKQTTLETSKTSNLNNRLNNISRLHENK